MNYEPETKKLMDILNNNIDNFCKTVNIFFNQFTLSLYLTNISKEN